MVQSITKAKIEQGVSGRLLIVFAVACGMSVANIYYNQPLLSDIARTFNAVPKQLGIVTMLTQIGFALGLLLIIPLGDVLERRSLIVTLLCLVTLSLLGVAMAPNIVWLAFANFAVGITTVVPQIIVPLAADMAGKNARGKVVGTVMSGLLIGILLARTVSGLVGSVYGWRVVYILAAVLMLVLAIILRLLLPKDRKVKSLKYRQLMQSTWSLAKGQPALWEASLLGGCLFGAFSLFWTTLIFFLEKPPYHYGSNVVGLFGLVGVVGASVAPIAGKLSDRYNPRLVAGGAAGITFLSFVVFGLFGYSLWGLIAGVILLDGGVQGAHISNQATIYNLVPDASSRLNSVYMVSYFVGGAIGSLVGAYAWNIWKWDGVSAAGLFITALALGTWLLHRMHGERILWPYGARK